MSDNENDNEPKDAQHDSLLPLKQRMERMSAKIAGETAYLKALATQLAEHQSLHKKTDDTEHDA